MCKAPTAPNAPSPSTRGAKCHARVCTNIVKKIKNCKPQKKYERISCTPKPPFLQFLQSYQEGQLGTISRTWKRDVSAIFTIF